MEALGVRHGRHRAPGTRDRTRDGGPTKFPRNSGATPAWAPPTVGCGRSGDATLRVDVDCPPGVAAAGEAAVSGGLTEHRFPRWSGRTDRRVRSADTAVDL